MRAPTAYCRWETRFLPRIYPNGNGNACPHRQGGLRRCARDQPRRPSERPTWTRRAPTPRNSGRRWRRCSKRSRKRGVVSCRSRPWPLSDTGPYQPGDGMATPPSGVLPQTVDHQAPASGPASSEGPGTQIGPYRLIEKLGEGGMGDGLAGRADAAHSPAGRAEDHQVRHGQRPRRRPLRGGAAGPDHDGPRQHRPRPGRRRHRTRAGLTSSWSWSRASR